MGTGLEEEALTAAGIERADAFIASTDGDNTNIVISQIAQRKFNVPTVIARILDPLRAEWYEKQGEDDLPDQGCDRDARGGGPGRLEGELMAERMYIIIAGAGKVGWNLARSCSRRVTR